MKKVIYLSVFLILTVLLSSCIAKEEYTIPFSISYFEDFQEIETIHSISSQEGQFLEDSKIGFKNGTYWFRVILLEKLTNTPIVFDLPKNSIDHVILYQKNNIVPYQELDNTRLSLLVDSNSQNLVYYFKVHFNKEVYFPLSIRVYDNTQLHEKYVFFINGCYYGFVLMVLIVNLFFYFSLKDKTFLYYCLFLTIITICILDYEGLLNNMFSSSFSVYQSLFIHFLIPFFGALFANHFLNIKYYLPQSNKTGIILLMLTSCSYLLFIPTHSFIFTAIGDTFTLLVLLYYWVIGIIILKKHNFAKFFVIGYSLILFTSFLFAIPLDWGLSTYNVSLNTIKTGSIFEMLILTYAITYRVNILQKENEQFRSEIQNYLAKINVLESHRNANESNIDVLIAKNNLSEREAEVLLLIAKGYTNQRIADELFISLNTVKYHIRNIYQKLNIKNKNEAIDLFTSV